MVSRYNHVILISILILEVLLDCQSINVILKNNVLSRKKSFQGIYNLHEKINGTSSWKSDFNAIWFISDDKYWAVGDLKNIGTKIRDISSSFDQNDKSPLDVENDQWYYFDEVWKKPGKSGDIIVECVNKKAATPRGKYNSKFY